MIKVLRSIHKERDLDGEARCAVWYWGDWKRLKRFLGKITLTLVATSPRRGEAEASVQEGWRLELVPSTRKRAPCCLQNLADSLAATSLHTQKREDVRVERIAVNQALPRY